jgi:LuxR family maltose regulon positive regulatory protein
VLDDYHKIDNHTAHAGLAYMLDHLPQGTHIYIATRVDPPLPLPRLRARNQLDEVRERALRFSAQEAAVFLNEHMGLGLTPVEIEALESRTEGWAAGLQLAALSMQGRQDLHTFIADFTGGHHYILEYLTEEVLARQPEPVQDFLLLTSILERMCAPLCDAVAGRQDSQAMLEQLQRDNLFIIPLDDDRRWYRYHHLFADLLRARLEHTQPGQASALHLQAANWFEQKEYIAEAVQHALAGGEFERAADLVEGNAVALFNRGKLSDILRLVRRLPVELVNSRPWLSGVHAFALVTNGQLEGVEELLGQAEAHVQPGDASPQTADLLAGIATVRGQAANLRGDYQEAIEYQRLASQRVSPGNYMIRVHIQYCLGDVYYKTGDLEQAGQAYSQGLEIGKLSGSSLLFIPFYYDLAHLRKLQGRLRAARELYAGAERYINERDEQDARVACPLEVGLGELAYEWNDLETAEHHTLRGIELSELHGTSSSLVNAYLGLMRIHQAREDVRAAQEAFHQANETVQQYHLVKGTAHQVALWRVRLWLAAGDLVAAERWGDQLADDDQGALSLVADQCLTLARLRLAQGELSQAIELLERLQADANAAGQFAHAIQASILLAIAWKAKEDSNRSLQEIVKALALAEPEGYLRTFVDEGQPIRTLLGECKARIEEPGLQSYAAKILSAFDAPVGHLLPVKEWQARSDQPQTPTLELIEPLSEREMDVLQLICAGYSNQQIAETLVISLYTVKKHNSHIYGKLNVSSRAQAIIRARQLGLA